MSLELHEASEATKIFGLQKCEGIHVQKNPSGFGITVMLGVLETQISKIERHGFLVH